MIKRAIDRLTSRLLRGETMRGAVRIGAGAAGAQALGFAVSPILTRLFAPADFGVAAVATSILSLVVVVACLRYDFAIPLPESDADAANVLGVALVAALVMSSLTALVMFLVGGPILAALGAPSLAPYGPLLAIGVLGYGVVSAFVGWCLRTRDYGQVAKAQFAQGIVLVIVQLGLGILRWGAIGLVTGTIAGYVTRSTTLAQAAWRQHAQLYRGVTRGGIWRAAVRYRRFAILSGPSAVLDALGLQAPLLVMVALFGTTVGGYFSLATRIIGLPTSLVASAVGQVYFAQAARLVRSTPEQLMPLFWRTTRALAVASFVPFIVVALGAPVLFGLVFGPGWEVAGLYVTVLTPMIFLQLISGTTGFTLDVLERQDLHLTREIGRLILFILFPIIAAGLHAGPLAAVALVSVAGCLTYVWYGYTSWKAIKEHLERGGRRPREQGPVEAFSQVD